nr:hypothetical protein [Microbispora camponoti]
MSGDFAGELRHPCGVGLGGDVGGDGVERVVWADSTSQRFQRVDTDVRGDDGVAVAQESFDQDGADAFGGSGDDDDSFGVHARSPVRGGPVSGLRAAHCGWCSLAMPDRPSSVRPRK